jgi:hypothetical protein
MLRLYLSFVFIFGTCVALSRVIVMLFSKIRAEKYGKQIFNEIFSVYIITTHE